MKTANLGYEVAVDYDGILENGEVFDSTSETEPIVFVIGTASVLPAFEETVIGMQEGEQRSVQIEPKDAFGEHQQELVQQINKSVFGDRADQLKVGMVINLRLDEQEQQVPAQVTAITDDAITVDYNHPLAGQKVEYRLTLKAVGEKKMNLPPIAPPPEDN